jgi:5-methylcytosine-specific restriction enzyme subunit McrC
MWCHPGDAAITIRGDLGRPSSFRPDVLLRLPSPTHSEARWLPMDAKYKAYGRDAVPTPDLHQLLTYIAGYSNASTPTAAILHPQRGDHTHRVLNVAGPRGLLGTIHVVGIDTRVAPREQPRGSVSIVSRSRQLVAIGTRRLQVRRSS